MQLDTTNRGFHPDDIERLCEERRKGTGISRHDSGVAHDFSSIVEQRQAGIGAFNSIPGHTQNDLGKLGGRQEVTHMYRFRSH